MPVLATLALTVGVASADVVVLDTITPGTWQNQPGWIVPTSYAPSTAAGVGIRVIGNGQRLTRLELIVSMWDGATQVTTVGVNDARMWIRAFTNDAAFLGANWTYTGNPLPIVRNFINPNWNVPLGIFGGVRYYRVEVDLSSLAITPSIGQQVILGAAYQNINAGIPHIGAAQGALGGNPGGDLYVLQGLYAGSTAGFIAQYGNPPQAGVTHVAARVWSQSPPCPADLNADTFVDDADFVLFASAYNVLLCSDPAMPANCPADLNNDDVVDDADFVLFAAAYNELLCP
jgi:hypothetical protein